MTTRTVARGMASDFVPTMLLNAAALWRSAIEDLSPHISPYLYLTPARWAPTRERAQWRDWLAAGLNGAGDNSDCGLTGVVP